jgi:hypothetical protein
MTAASERAIHALEHIVKAVPVGTNLALLHLLWAMLSGAFLRSRGAVFSAAPWLALQWPRFLAFGRRYAAVHGASPTFFLPGAAMC